MSPLLTFCYAVCVYDAELFKSSCRLSALCTSTGLYSRAHGSQLLVRSELRPGEEKEKRKPSCCLPLRFYICIWNSQAPGLPNQTGHFASSRKTQVNTERVRATCRHVSSGRTICQMVMAYSLIIKLLIKSASNSPVTSRRSNHAVTLNKLVTKTDLLCLLHFNPPNSSLAVI